MSRASIAVYPAIMVALIVVVDVLFFKNRPGARLVANVVIVLVFAAVYMRFLQRP